MNLCPNKAQLWNVTLWLQSTCRCTELTTNPIPWDTFSSLPAWLPFEAQVNFLICSVLNLNLKILSQKMLNMLNWHILTTRLSILLANTFTVLPLEGCRWDAIKWLSKLSERVIPGSKLKFSFVSSIFFSFSPNAPCLSLNIHYEHNIEVMYHWDCDSYVWMIHNNVLTSFDHFRLV